MRLNRILMAALVGAMALTMTASQASHEVKPQATSAFLTDWCNSTNNATVAGQGASFQKRAQLDAFIPAWNDKCDHAVGKVTYLSSGSGKGKSAACRRPSSHQFGATDDALTVLEWAQYSGDLGAAQASGAPACAGHVPPQASPIHHFPTAVGGVTAVYNLRSCGIGTNQLNLSSPALGGIFAGTITSWGDALITIDNGHLSAAQRSCMAGKTIRPAVRLDGSGTTWIWKAYLSKRNPEYIPFKDPALNQAWPADTIKGPSYLTRCDKNEGVALCVFNTDAGVGYVEYAAALFQGNDIAKIDNPAHQFVAPSIAGFEAAGLEAVPLAPPTTMSPGWDAVDITDGPNGYPATGLTYMLVYNNLKAAFGTAMAQAQAQRLVDFLGVILDPRAGFGQSRLNAANYGRLPEPIRQLASTGLTTVCYC